MTTIAPKLAFSSLKYLLACTVVMAGCDFDIGGGTPGQEGEIEFSFAGNAFLDCFLGCDVDRPIAVGAGATLVILDDTPEKSFTVRVPDGVSASYEESFECERVLADDTIELRQIEPHESCNEGEQRTAFRTVTVTASEAGTLLVEVLHDGELLDAVELEARPAAGAVILDASDESLIDALAVQSGQTLNISADLIDAEGTPLYFDTLEHEWTVGDEGVAEVEYFWFDLGGATSIALRANEPGTTTVRFDAAGVSHEIPLTVE